MDEKSDKCDNKKLHKWKMKIAIPRLQNPKETQVMTFLWCLSSQLCYNRYSQGNMSGNLIIDSNFRTLINQISIHIFSMTHYVKYFIAGTWGIKMLLQNLPTNMKGELYEHFNVSKSSLTLNVNWDFHHLRMKIARNKVIGQKSKVLKG